MATLLIDRLVGLFVRHNIYVERLNLEYSFFEGGQRVTNRADHLSFITDMLHARSAALISYIAIATAVLLFLVADSHGSHGPYAHAVLNLGLISFLGLALISLRLIQPFGLDRTFCDREEAFEALLVETARKFAAFQFCLKGSQLVTSVMVISILVLASLTTETAIGSQ